MKAKSPLTTIDKVVLLDHINHVIFFSELFSPTAIAGLRDRYITAAEQLIDELVPRTR